MPSKHHTQAEQSRDSEIAGLVRHALKLNNNVPDERIRVDVENGVVTLGGSVYRNLEKEAAEEAANKVQGVRSVLNRIEALEAHGVTPRKQNPS